jgi:hypothetical protein
MARRGVQPVTQPTWGNTNRRIAVQADLGIKWDTVSKIIKAKPKTQTLIHTSILKSTNVFILITTDSVSLPQCQCEKKPNTSNPSFQSLAKIPNQHIFENVAHKIPLVGRQKMQEPGILLLRHKKRPIITEAFHTLTIPWH